METVTVENPFSQIIERESHVDELPSREKYSRVDVRFADLLRYECVNRWLRKREPRTKYEYLNRFEKFFQWSKARINVENPDQLLAWAKATEGTTVSDVIEEYNEDKGVSNGQMGMAVLRSFLRRNGYNGLPKVDWESTLSFVEGYSRQEIQSLLSYLDSPFQKLYVNVCKDSGLRSNDVLAIQYRNIQPDIEDPKQDHVEIHFEKEAYLRKK